MITLLTDFSESDFYVGSMKGVILNINPSIQIVDISHNVCAQNIDQGAFILKQAYHHFPEGTIHVVVVDPGVGSNRPIIAVSTDDYIFLAPDNGILKYIFNDYPECKVVNVTNDKYFLDKVSFTFHGRDIFAPVAAHLSLGMDLENFGNESGNYIKPDISKPIREKNTIIGEIVYIDFFGNCITNISSELLESKMENQIKIKNLVLSEIKTNYSEVCKGEILALVGSSETIEIAVNQGNAQEQFGLRVGDRVVIEEARFKRQESRPMKKEKKDKG